MLRILFAGGGTGGHITPIIAVSEELQKIAKEKSIEIEMRYMGEPDIYVSALESSGIKVSKIMAGKVRRYFDIRNILDIPKFLLSFPQLLWKIFWYMPDVVFSKGGTGSLPVVIIARFYRIPVLIHESDTVPGMSNQVAGRWARRVAISFDSVKEYFRGDIALTGSPIRNFLISGPLMEKGAAKKVFGLEESRPLILFLGGSQGAVRINDFVLDIILPLLNDFSALHQTGLENFEGVKKEFDVIAKDLSPDVKKRYKPVAYFENNLKEALIASDIAVSRAGSTTIFELATFGKPSILIPLPESAGNHQVKNAYEYAKNGAAIVMESDNLTPNVFITQIKNLISDSAKLSQMSEAARKFSKPDAAKIIAQGILEVATS
ncbi:MAG: UDP-N-acetylglucosamine--N-acetylmuramyl-(pentapeptide) pyrophosphoryl-undecaprenol N-acetylglucosamine transferase [Candidatus Wolfebacteria bacterium]|nr:UDP-N-acetylglucosamine--N-acetylmuramyl-(pentapeptide) pyrophosphoryl-undecaprenol N-acetylglucosamine transferase [Candidatus Wolfebacteria bacterium]